MTKSKFAAGTEVPVERSKTELERTLVRYGASSFVTGWDESRTVVEFLYDGRRVRFEVPAHAGESEQVRRQAWRVLILLVKAKFEAIATGHASFEAEFLAQLVLEGGQTVGERLVPDLDALPSAGPLLALGRGR